MKLSAKPVILLLLLSAFISVAGCAGFHAKSPNVINHIDDLVEEHRYDQALEIISIISPDHQEYDEIMARAVLIREKREKAISNVIEEARLLEEGQDWAGALSIVDNAIKTFENEPSLILLREKYEGLRLEKIQQSNHSIFMARARYLSEIRESEEALLLADPDGMASRRRYQNYQQELKSTSETLLLKGIQALEENDTQAALQALILSTRLHPNDRSQKLLSKIYIEKWEQRIKESQSRVTVEVEAEDQWPRLSEAFNHAIQIDDVTGARAAVKEMTAIDAEQTGVFINRLEKYINRKTKVLNARGCMLYEQGLIEEALSVWQEALLLKPGDPELIQNIRRAETFIENIHRWKEQ
jgi:tetratricopeptide (TPR) repeat protein